MEYNHFDVIVCRKVPVEPAVMLGLLMRRSGLHSLRHLATTHGARFDSLRILPVEPPYAVLTGCVRRRLARDVSIEVVLNAWSSDESHVLIRPRVSWARAKRLGATFYEWEHEVADALTNWLVAGASERELDLRVETQHGASAGDQDVPSDRRREAERVAISA